MSGKGVAQQQARLLESPMHPVPHVFQQRDPNGQFGARSLQPLQRTRERAIEAYGRHHCNLTKAACEVGVHRTTLWRWAQEANDFAEALENCRAELLDEVEAEIFRRAVIGWDEPLSYQGRLTGDVIHRYSDRLLEYLSKALAPEKYRERYIVQATDQVLVIQAEGLLAQRSSLPSI